MARPLRLAVPNGWYHVTVRGNERKPIFRAEEDRLHFLELLGQTTDRFALVVHAYTMMDNHYHLIVQTPQANLSAAMQWLGVSYSVWFNRRHRRVGHLFEGRFKGVSFDGDDAWELSRYVHLNPVRLAKYGLGVEKMKCHAVGDRREQPSLKALESRPGWEEVKKGPWGSQYCINWLDLLQDFSQFLMDGTASSLGGTQWMVPCDRAWK